MSKISKTELQSAYAAFVSGFNSKLTYFICTIHDNSDLPLPLQHTIRQKLIPAITVGQICSNDERLLLSSPTRYGGLNIPFFHETAGFEYENSGIRDRTLSM